MRNIQPLDEITDALLSPAVRQAVVRDGWPAPMVEAGFDLHRTTWQGLGAAIRDELSALDPDVQRALLRDQSERTVAHLWPALPGAGVTPALFGFLLGVGTQWIKPSSRGRHFAEAAVEAWRCVDHASVALCGDEWSEADHVIVSGDDDTVAAVIERVGSDRVVGYGHRVSGGLIVDDGDAERHARGLATDIVMWHQLGCFSARGIIFVGSRARATLFAEALAAAIADVESALGATEVDEATAAHRMQRLGRAEFETDVWRARIGWVERRDAWRGDWISRHAISFVVAEDQTEALERIAVAPGQLQGMALGADDELRAAWTLALINRGATRVCAPGALQAPESDWLHDGYSNVRALTGPGVGRVGDNVGARKTPNRVG